MPRPRSVNAAAAGRAACALKGAPPSAIRKPQARQHLRAWGPERDYEPKPLVSPHAFPSTRAQTTLSLPRINVTARLLLIFHFFGVIALLARSARNLMRQFNRKVLAEMEKDFGIVCCWGSMKPKRRMLQQRLGPTWTFLIRLPSITSDQPISAIAERKDR